MSFNATDDAFEGFRLTRRAPLTILWWSAAYIVFMVLCFLPFAGSFVQLMSELERLEGQSNPSPDELMMLGGLYFSIFGPILPLALAFGAVINAAVVRSVLEPGRKAFGYMRVGMDELRVLVVSFVLGLVFFACWGVGLIVVGVAAGFAGATQQPALWILAVLAFIAVAAFIIWLMIRLSLAVPITVAERRFAFFDSFALSKGRLWPLLGMAIIAGVMSILVSLLGSVVAMPLTLAVGGLDRLAGLEGASLQEILNVAAPAIVVWVILNAILSVLQLAILYAPFSAAYRGIKGQAPG